MAEILPFRALRYYSNGARDLACLVTQPYDKITPEMQARYYESSPYNLARIILGRKEVGDDAANNVYRRAARDFQAWIRQGVLQPDREPSLYIYNQEYAMPGQPSERKLRRGVIVLCHLEDYSAGVIHRHEETLAGPKADRLELLKATRAHFGQIFLLYSDPSGAIEEELLGPARRRPESKVTDEYGTTHSLWRVSEPKVIETVSEAMRGRKLVIADGHHRYETALAYRDLRRAQGAQDQRADYVMATLVRLESEGLTILPTHRVVHGLPAFDWSQFRARAVQFFNWEETQASGSTPATALLEKLARAGEQGPSFVAFAGSRRAALISLRNDLDLERELAGVPEALRCLDVVVLHRLALERILGIDPAAVREEKNLRYLREAEAALQAVLKAEGQGAFLTNPTPAAAVWSNALAGQPLPQKSTDFYPKLLSGLAIYWLDNPAGI